jgi:hypothetical protein
MVKKKATEKSDATLADVLNLYIETRLAEGCKPLTVRFYTQLICFWQAKSEQFCHSKIEQVSLSFH